MVLLPPGATPGQLPAAQQWWQWQCQLLGEGGAHLPHFPVAGLAGLPLGRQLQSRTWQREGRGFPLPAQPGAFSSGSLVCFLPVGTPRARQGPSRPPSCYAGHIKNFACCGKGVPRWVHYLLIHGQVVQEPPPLWTSWASLSKCSQTGPWVSLAAALLLQSQLPEHHRDTDGRLLGAGQLWPRPSCCSAIQQQQDADQGRKRPQGQLTPRPGWF